MLALPFNQLSANLDLVLLPSGPCREVLPPQPLFSTNAVAEQPATLPPAQFWHITRDPRGTQTEGQENARPAAEHVWQEVVARMDVGEPNPGLDHAPANSFWNDISGRGIRSQFPVLEKKQ